MCLSSGFGDLLNTRRCISEPTSQWRRLAPHNSRRPHSSLDRADTTSGLFQPAVTDRSSLNPAGSPLIKPKNLFKQSEPALMMKVKIVCAITMLAAVPAAAETKSPPIRQALVHEYARKQLPLARAAHAATYACHEVTSDCDFASSPRKETSRSRQHPAGRLRQ